MTAILSNLQAVHNAMEKAARLAQREVTQIRLLAVSKKTSSRVLREAYSAGQSAFGENFLQEGLDKIHDLQDLPLEWHFIGPIQSNKTRQIAENFSWVHSVDRLKIAQRLSEQRPASMPALNICLQVNISGEASKSGVTPEDALDMALTISVLPHLQLRGLMAIPSPTDDRAAQRAPYARMRELMLKMNQAGLNLDTLSMGMSHDMEAAILEGATIIRVGTAIFGARA